MTVTGLPPIPETAIPADVRREGGTAVYKAALGFESMLLDQLSQSLVEGSGIDDSPYASEVSSAFSQSLLQGGGIGLAEQLYSALNGVGARDGATTGSGDGAGGAAA